jgi:hypothetical protein
MALIKCPECGRENVSDSAESCPNCGYGIKAHFEQIKIKRYYHCNTLFSFLDGFEDGITGKYTVDADNVKRSYSVRNGKVILPSKEQYIILDDFLIKEDDDTFKGQIPAGNMFSAIITEQIPKIKWTFSQNGVLKMDDGEIGVYKRCGDFLAYKISNHSGITWRDRAFDLLIYNNELKKEYYVSEQRYNELITLRNEVQNTEYPFVKPEPLEPFNYSYLNSNTPKCPTCGSTNIQKISGTKRWVTTGLFGLASSNVGKIMECKNCGYKW